MGHICMDCGYFIGTPEGLKWFPPVGSKEKPCVIPWPEVLPEDYQPDEPIVVDNETP
jgi:hypothetical protein